MIARKPGANPLQQQVARISSLTDELRDTVAGIKEGKSLIRSLQKKLELDHQTLAARHQKGLQKILGDGCQAIEQLQGQKEKLGKLVESSRRQIEKLTHSLEQQIERTHQQLVEIRSSTASYTEKLEEEWVKEKGRNERFREDVEHKVTIAWRRASTCEESLQQQRERLDGNEERSERLDKETADCRWRINQLESLQEQQKLINGKSRQHQLIVNVLVGVLVVWSLLAHLA